MTRVYFILEYGCYSYHIDSRRSRYVTLTQNDHHSAPRSAHYIFITHTQRDTRERCVNSELSQSSYMVSPTSAPPAFGAAAAASLFFPSIAFDELNLAKLSAKRGPKDLSASL